MGSQRWGAKTGLTLPGGSRKGAERNVCVCVSRGKVVGRTASGGSWLRGQSWGALEPSSSFRG